MKLEMDIDVSFDAFKLAAVLSLDAPIAAIFGPPGSGKSTVLGAIAGVVNPQKGWIRVGEELLYDARNGIRVPASQRHIRLVGGRLTIYPHRYARDFLEEGVRSMRHSEAHEPMSEIVRLMKIEELLDVPYSELDYQQRQRVAIAYALLGAPRLLLVDTFTDDGMNCSIKPLLPFIRHIREHCGVSVIYVSDDLRSILESAEQLVLMAEGRILGAGDTNSLLAERIVTGYTPLKGIENIMLVTLISHEKEQGCSIGYYYGTQLILPLLEELSVSTDVEVCVRSNDIALAKRPVDGISIQNQIKGRICTIIKVSRHAIVQIDCGTTILAGISLKALNEMQLKEGDVVYCLIKTHAFSYQMQTNKMPSLTIRQGNKRDQSIDASRIIPIPSHRRH